MQVLSLQILKIISAGQTERLLDEPTEPLALYSRLLSLQLESNKIIVLCLLLQCSVSKALLYSRFHA